MILRDLFLYTRQKMPSAPKGETVVIPMQKTYRVLGKATSVTTECRGDLVTFNNQNQSTMTIQFKVNNQILPFTAETFDLLEKRQKNERRGLLKKLKAGITVK